MSVVEIDAPPCPLRADPALRDLVTSVTPAMLALSPRPDFLPPGVTPAAGGSLWEALRLSWIDPQTKRDLLGG